MLDNELWKSGWTWWLVLTIFGLIIGMAGATHGSWEWGNVAQGIFLWFMLTLIGAFCCLMDEL